jgi:spore cortex formation protein SpoVR/YcgB (stage V sporulation)
MDWSPELLHDIWQHIEDIAKNDLKLDYYQPSFEVISAEQMLDAYSSVGLPINYHHWSFGKEFMKNSQKYQKGKMGLAYEIVINTDPCICYLMEENNAITQTLVMAHAAAGHSFVFKNNYLFKEWTSASGIIDYMMFAKNYIRDCEEKYGEDEVELVIDAAHALAQHGIDKSKRKHKKRLNEEQAAAVEMEKVEDEQRNLDIILKKTSIQEEVSEKKDTDLDDVGDEENLLYFIYKNAPNMPQWQKEILRIIYKVNQYFYPQGQCVTGDNLIATGSGLLRLDELITSDGLHKVAGIELVTKGDKFTPISHTFLRRGASVLKVTTKTGREFIGTPEHPLMALDGAAHSVKKLEDLAVGDSLVLNLDYRSVFSPQEIALQSVTLDDTVECKICGFKSSYLPSHIKDTHGMRPSVYEGALASSQHSADKSTNYPSKFPSTLTPELAELLGYMEGMTMPSGAASVFGLTGNFEQSSHYTQLLNSVFGIQVVPDEECNTVFSSWGLRKFIELNFDFKQPGLMKQLRQSPAPVIAGYIKGLVDRWSVLRTTVGNFTLASRSDAKLHDLQVILGALGIVSVISSHDNPSLAYLLSTAMGMEGEPETYVTYSLWIPDDYRARYCEVIGSALSLAIDDVPNINSLYSATIPGAKELLCEINDFVRATKKKHLTSVPRSMNYATRVKNGLLWKQQDLPALMELPSVRGAVLYVADVSSQLPAFERALSVPCEAAVKLRQLLEASTGCYYDPVVSVEWLEEKHDVYDVTVPENHLFWMSGLISHNTKVLNEGMATFTHFYIMDELEKRGIISADAQIAWLHLHSNVVYQPDMHSRHYDASFNPYALGFDILKEVRRICEDPTAEDREWFPELIGKDWREEVKNAATNYRDESFIQQFLSPNLMRKYKMMSIEFNKKIGVVTEISDDQGYRNMRTALAQSYARVNYIPELKVKSARMRGDRTLTIEYVPFRGRSLHKKSAEQTIQHVKLLWGYPVEIVKVDENEAQTLLFKA